MLLFLKRFFQNLKERGKQDLPSGAIIVDVRTRPEYEQAHAAGSKNIPLNEIRSKTEMIRKWNKPVIIVCRSGARSAMAKRILQAAGIEAYNGGAWTSPAHNRIK
jgi:rhodanese-related sulfurtransferase